MASYSKPNLEEKELGFSSADSLSEEALIQEMGNLVLKSNVNSNGNGTKDIDDLGSGGLLPLRPYADDCSHYMRTGTCKFGVHCWYNHPARMTQQLFKDKESGSYNVGTIECKYFSAAGGCKHGKLCRYFHPGEDSEHTAPEMNFLGLPLRPGVKECPYYMRTGSCGYGSQCIHHHPDPTSAGVRSPISVDEIPGKPFSLSDNYLDSSLHLLGTSNHHKQPWSSCKLFENIAPYSQTHLSPEWLGEHSEPIAYQGDIVMPTSQATISSHRSLDSHSNPLAKGHTRVDEFPERPGQHVCNDYMKTGDCEYQCDCLFHHPKNRKLKPEECGLNEIALPLRPGRVTCWHFARSGHCKFGQACHFDHPPLR